MASSGSTLDTTELRRLIRCLHRILRDSECNSSLVERFDELTKVLYCKTLAEAREETGNGTNPFSVHAHDTDRQVARRLHAFLADLVRKHRALFPQRFAHFGLADTTLRRLVDALAPIQLSSPDEDLKGLAYEEVIHNTFDKGDHQQFFTPRPIVEFMVQLLDWSQVRVVCDPACGTGGFLLFVDRVLKRRKRKAPALLLGFEIDERLAWVARINLHLHDAAPFEIQHLKGAGSLGPAVRRHFGQVDAIVTNPPFGSDLSDAEALAEFELGKERGARRRGVLFLERCLDLLKSGGMLAIVIDDGVLNSPSNADTRRLLLERSHPRAVISLPETTFLPYATVKASILIVQKKGGRLQAAHDTLFAQAEVVGRKPNGEPLVRFDPATKRMEIASDLPAILEAWNKGQAASEQIFWTNLPAATEGTFARDGYRLDLAYHHPARQEALRALRASPHPLRSLREICELRSELIVPATDLPEEELTYLGLANLEAHTGVCAPALVNAATLKSAVKRFRAGDILFAKMRPELRKVCLIPAEIDEGYASAECLVLVPRIDERTGRPLMLPELLAILLRSDLVYGQVVHLVMGIGRPRLSRAAVLDVRFPCPPLREQRRLLERYRRSEQAAQALLVESRQAAEKASQIIREAHTRLAGHLLTSGLTRP